MPENRQEHFGHVATGRSVREWGIRLALLFAGLTTAHLGVTLFILSRLGSDPFTIFVQGLSVMTDLSVGTCHVIVMTILTAVMLLTTRGYVKPGTFVCMLFGGPIIDIFSWLLGGWLHPGIGMALRIAVMLMGACILAIGMSLVIKSDAGTGTNDLVAVILTDKLARFQFRWVRMGCDIFFTLAGLALGGIFGIGTIAAALLVGPIAQVFFKPWGRIVDWFVSAFRGNAVRRV